MNNHRLRTVALSALVVAGMTSGPASAAQLDNVLSSANEVHDQARRSQMRVDEITEETRKLLNEYKTVMKEVEGLRVYNGQLERQIANQEQEMADLNESIDKVTLVERQITPLMIRMIDGLEQFIELDVPFLMDERTDRVERLRDIMDRADVEVSEKFSQVLNAYQIENEYGRTMEAYTNELELGGSTLVVDFLRMGRVALVYQTTDGERSGVWDQEAGTWQELDPSYNSSIRNGIRIARQQAAVDLITLPIPGPEAAR
jgi:predicted RNase H-like nuclease (RuvC/YqgF family)